MKRLPPPPRFPYSRRQRCEHVFIAACVAFDVVGLILDQSAFDAVALLVVGISGIVVWSTNRRKQQNRWQRAADEARWIEAFGMHYSTDDSFWHKNHENLPDP